MEKRSQNEKGKGREKKEWVLVARGDKHAGAGEDTEEKRRNRKGSKGKGYRHGRKMKKAMGEEKPK